MQSSIAHFTVELADGRVLAVDTCPVTGGPMIDDRDLLAGQILPFSQEKPPQFASRSHRQDATALRCG